LAGDHLCLCHGRGLTDSTALDCCA
jgi:hypothetical protein